MKSQIMTKFNIRKTGITQAKTETAFPHPWGGRLVFMEVED